MNNEPTTRPQVNDEVDLLELFNRMGRSIRNGFNWVLSQLLNLFKLILRKSIWIIAFGIIGLIIAYLYYLNSRRYYSSEMIAISNAVNNSYVVGSINMLNDAFKQKNHATAASFLDMDINKIQQIKSVEAFYTLDLNKDNIPDITDYLRKWNPKDTSIRRLSNYFVVRIDVFDENVFAGARDGLKKYIYKNKFIIDNNNERIRQNQILIQNIGSEIRKLDSLQTVEYFQLPQMQRAASNQMVVLNEKDRKLYHEQKLNLEKEKLRLEKEININSEPITIVQDFTPLSKAENPYSKYAVIMGLIFAMLGFATSIIWQYRTFIWDAIKNRHY